MTTATQGAAYLMDRGEMTVATWAVSLLTMLIGVALVIGVVTPLAGGLAGLEALSLALSWLPQPALNLFDAKLPTVFVVIVAAAVIFLGPGAFSLDARLFGRRKILIPHPARSTKS